MQLTPVIAELGSIEKMVITALAVAGGFLVGFLFTNLVARLLSRFVWKKEPPEKMIRLLRFAGGVAGAIIVYLLLTGSGGLGLGGGGGDGDKGKEKQQGQNQNPDQPKQEPKNDEPKQKDNATEPKGVLTVYVLRFDSPERRFYRIGADGKPLALEELLREIDDRTKNDKKGIAQVDIEVGDPEYPVQAVSVLEVELNQRGIKSTRPIVKKSKN